LKAKDLSLNPFTFCHRALPYLTAKLWKRNQSSKKIPTFADCFERKTIGLLRSLQ
jgi:hypothetical protein